MAFPGSLHNSVSKGCHGLIKQNLAHLIENADDIVQLLGWTNNNSKHNKQREIPLDLSPTEAQINSELLNVNALEFDILAHKLNIPVHILSSELTMMELKGLIKQIPGNKFTLA